MEKYTYQYFQKRLEEIKKIEIKETHRVKEVFFDPDSSPAAWEFYKKIYQKFKDDSPFCIYDFENLHYYTSYSNKYYDCPSQGKEQFNRLFIFPKELESIGKTEVGIYYPPTERLGGETDFNFNEKKQNKYKKIFEKDKNISNEKKEENIRILTELMANMHHSCINFSLMQGMGNLQSVKGRDGYDRLDKLVFKLNDYYEKGDESEIYKKNNNNENGKCLLKYLDDFENINDYMYKIYFIKEEKDGKDNFIQRLIQFSSKEICDSESALEYFDLAVEFWKRKYNDIKNTLKK